MKQVIISLMMGVGSLDLIFFFFLLFRKLYIKRMQDKKASRWEILEQKLHLYVGQQEDSFFRSLSPFDKKILEEMLLQYTTYVKGDMKKKLLHIARITGVIHSQIQKLSSRQWWTKAIAAHTLGSLGAEEASPFLIEQMETEHMDVRYQIMLSLIKISGAAHLEEIIDQLQEHSLEMKSRKLDLLNAIEKSEDLYPMMEKIIQKKQPEDIALGLLALGKRKDPRVIPFIKKYLHHPDKEVRIAVYKVVEEFGDIGDTAYFYLVLQGKEDPSWEVRSFLAKALGSFLRRESIEVLKYLMKDSNWLVRLNAGNSLQQHKEKGLFALSRMLCSKDPYARDRAFQILQEEIFFHGLEEKLLKNDGFIYKQIRFNIDVFYLKNLGKR